MARQPKSAMHCQTKENDSVKQTTRQSDVTACRAGKQSPQSLQSLQRTKVNPNETKIPESKQPEQKWRNSFVKEYQADQVEQMAKALNEGQILAFPTDTVYGVGTIYGDAQALSRLKQIKHRPETKPVPMMVSRLEAIESIVEVTDMAKILADAFLPGALTLIMPLKEHVDRCWTNGKDTAAVRIPNAPVLLKVMDQLDRPLMVTSANISGEPAALTKKEAMDMLPGLDGILDGDCHDLQASTIIDCTKEEPVVLRQGPISQEQIEQAWKAGKKQ